MPSRTPEPSPADQPPSSRPEQGRPPRPSLTLPKGGGALRGIDEKFSVNPASGTASLSIPLPFSPGRGSLSPSLSITYDSGAGNGPFGLGWSLSIPQISRKTEKSLPRYEDGADSDVFLLSGVEDLVPALKGDGGRDSFSVDGFTVLRYRPRVEGLFARIERWTDAAGDVHWRSTTKDNVTSLYGRTAAARLADPADPRRVYKWFLEETRDDRGNIVRYEYKPEDAAGVPASDLFERNRPSGSFANVYLKNIFYGNQTPFQADGWHFQAVLDYGEHDEAAPAPEGTKPWPRRADPFSFFKPGFDVRTHRLCRRALMFHRFDELGPAPCLVRSLDFTYEEDPAGTMMASAVQSGYIRGASGYSKKSIPPLEFSYTRAVIDDEIRTLEPGSLENAPEGLGGPRSRWVDLDGEGLSGLLTETPGAWLYKRNLGDGVLAPLETVAAKPSPGLSAGAQLMDLANEGRKSLVSFDGPVPGFFGRDGGGEWKPFTPFAGAPVLSWSDPNQRFLDLNGDGLAEVLITEDDVFSWHPSLGKEGFGPRQRARKAREEEAGPRVVFADAAQSVYLADMSGGGLSDIVRIRNGEVCYWPNLGYGRFGAKVTMSDAPVFDAPDQFSQSRVRLADVDGRGPSDLIYLGRDEIRLWTNRSGNAWGAPRVLADFPRTDDLAEVSVVDLLGNGTACLVWSSPLPRDAVNPLRYINLMGGVKPGLLASIKNNLGAESRLQYAPSTRFYLQDAAAGTPWITRLPFPVHVLERSETYDHVTGSRFVSTYSYHHGYYDGPEQEFRGFGRVDQTDTEEFAAFQGAGLFPAGTNAVEAPLHVPPVVIKTWFHTGAYLEGERLSNRFALEYNGDDLHPQAAPPPAAALPPDLTAAEEAEALRALKGSVLRQETYALDGTAVQSHPYSVSQRSYAVRRVQPFGNNPHAVFQAIPSESLEFLYERNPDDPRITHELTLDSDAYGQVLASASVAYARRVPLHPEQARTIVTCVETGLLNLDQGAGAYRLGLPVEARRTELFPPAPAAALYRPSELLTALASLPEIPFEADPAPTSKRTLERHRNYYWDDALSGPLPLGQAGSRALSHSARAVVFTPGLIAQAYEGRVDDALLAGEGRYILEDGVWWAPSDVEVFSPAAFYAPVQRVDPFGNRASFFLDPYALLLVRTETSQDPVLNAVTTAVNDYRMLSVVLKTDPNGNRDAVRVNELGLVTATALMGKESAGEGDTLDDPTTRLEYDLSRWMLQGLPAVVHAFAREKHGAANTRWLETREFSDGYGRVVQKKLKAAPAPGESAPRWVGTGRTVFNNKGKPVKQYEPFFTASPEYEDEADLVMTGVTPVIHYDPLVRVVRTDRPDGTHTRAVLGAWRRESWDPNDTVLDSPWYASLGSPDPAGPAPSGAEARAAWLSAQAAATPVVEHVDALGRVFLVVADNGPAGTSPTRSELDAKGKVRRVVDALGRTVVRRVFDVLGQEAMNRGMDGGARWVLRDIAGKPIRTWDERGHRARMTYDVLQRLTGTFVSTNGGPEVLSDLVVYGDGLPQAQEKNLKGVAHLGFDGAGLSVCAECDFKGNQVSAFRRLAAEYKASPSWNVLDGLSDPAAILAAAEPLLEAEAFAARSEWDALNRVAASVTPDDSVLRSEYDDAGLLKKVSVSLHGEGPGTVFIARVDYDAKGQRTLVEYGNGVRTTYAYDPLTTRLRRLLTLRAGTALQDLNHSFDAVGNVTEARDDAQQTVYFNNAVVDPSIRYEYDALYRLVRAWGREHRGQGASPQVDHDDSPRMGHAHPEDGQALRLYTEEYAYDAVGNLLSMAHTADQGNWTRRYQYASDSNRLAGTSRPGDADGVFSALYPHDAHGNMTAMPHLASITWDFRDRMTAVDLQGGGTAYFTYAADGARVRKVVESLQGTIRERIVLGAYEIYRERAGSTVALARETLHVKDDKKRFALVETAVAGPDPRDPVVRYQMGNLLDSATLELSADGDIVSYEEYHPYGSTSYQAGRSTAEVSLKRYRFAGQERDEETGLYHCGARYYAPWLGRWTAADPAGLRDGVNLYAYGRGNPAVFTDPNGTTNEPKTDVDRTIMQMTDPQLGAHMRGMSPGARYAFVNGASGAFANRASAMANKYDMKQVCELPEDKVVGDPPGKGIHAPVPIVGDKSKLAQFQPQLQAAGVFFMPDNSADIGTPVHLIVLPVLQARLAKHGIPSFVEYDTLTGGSKSGIGKGEIDLTVVVPPVGGGGGVYAHLYDLKPGGSSGKLEYIDQIRRYADFFDDRILAGVVGGVTPLVGTILYEVEVQHPDVLAPVDVPFTGGEVYIGLQLKGAGFIEYHLGVRTPPFVPVPVPDPVEEEGKAYDIEGERAMGTLLGWTFVAGMTGGIAIEVAGPAILAGATTEAPALAPAAAGVGGLVLAPK